MLTGSNPNVAVFSGFDEVNVSITNWWVNLIFPSVIVALALCYIYWDHLVRAMWPWWQSGRGGVVAVARRSDAPVEATWTPQLSHVNSTVSRPLTNRGGREVVLCCGQS